MPGNRPHKRNKIILLLREGETSPTIIANKVGCNSAYVNIVKKELARSQKQ